jgi:hypothetical protein
MVYVKKEEPVRRIDDKTDRPPGRSGFVVTALVGRIMRVTLMPRPPIGWQFERFPRLIRMRRQTIGDEASIMG